MKVLQVALEAKKATMREVDRGFEQPIHEQLTDVVAGDFVSDLQKVG
jgi:S-adenosylmethionine decarboxylase